MPKARGSHTPLEVRRAHLSGAERANLRQRRIPLCPPLPNLSGVISILFEKLKVVNLTSYDSACDLCLIHNGYGRVNALSYENALSRRAYV